MTCGKSRFTLLIQILMFVISGQALVAANTLEPVQQQQLLQEKRESIFQRYDHTARQCWQLFMVNDCLQEARLERRRALVPIEQQEHALRATKRAQAVSDRLDRLDAKKSPLEITNDSQP
jgi:hypothetical protein